MQPESKLMFKEFKDLPKEEMRGNKRLRGLALSIMYKLTEYIDRIDDPQSLEDLMMNTSKAHHRRDVGPKQFKVNNSQDWYWVPQTLIILSVSNKTKMMSSTCPNINRGKPRCWRRVR